MKDRWRIRLKELFIDVGIGILWALGVAFLCVLAGGSVPFIYIDF